MKEDKTEQGNDGSSGCFAKMKEMMSEMMSNNKGGICCSFAQKMAEKMPECCGDFRRKESPTQKAEPDAAK